MNIRRTVYAKKEDSAIQRAAECTPQEEEISPQQVPQQEEEEQQQIIEQPVKEPSKAKILAKEVVKTAANFGVQKRKIF